MSIDISIEDNFDGLEGFLDELKTKAVIDATRFSINRALVTVRDRSVKKVRERLAVKAGVLKKKHLVIVKAKGGNLFTMEGLIKYNTTPIPLLEFVTGSKQPRSQKGVAISRRKPLKARIRPGKTIKLRHAFIATVKSKQVFKRAGAGTRKVKKQGITSVGFVFNKPGVRGELIKLAGKRFKETFERDFKRRVFKAAQRRNKRMRTRR